MSSLIELIKRNLYVVADNLQFGLYGSKIKSIQGDVRAALRTTTDNDDELHCLTPDETDYARVRTRDVRGDGFGVAGTYIIDQEITSGGLPGAPSAGQYALVTSTFGTYVANEVYRYWGTTWTKITLEHGKAILIRKAGGCVGFVIHTLYWYKSSTGVWSESGVVGAIGTPPDSTYGGARGNISGLTVDYQINEALDKQEVIIGEVQYGVTKRRKYTVLFSQGGTVALDTIPANYHIENVTVKVVTTFDGVGDQTVIKLDATTLITLDDTELIADEIYDIPVETEESTAVVVSVVNTFTLSTQGAFEVVVSYRGRD